MRLRAAALPLLFLALLPAACGDDDSGGGECGPGTVLMDGHCIPDGSVICETGTTYNADTGKCDPDISGCGEGTVLVDGECVPDDGTIEADLEEMPEPNDGFEEGDAIAGMLDLPDIGADGVVVHGCVTPYRDLDDNGNPDIDYDMWLVSTSGPALVEITADGVGGLAAGFFLLPGEQQSLIDAGWQRFGLNLTGDTSKRQVYLPAGGIYALVMSDSRSLFLDDGAAGSEDTCYYSTISQVAMPEPLSANADQAIEGNIGSDTIFYSFPAYEGGIIDALHTIDSGAAFPSLVGLRNGAFAGYGEPGFFNPAAEVFVGGMAATDDVVVAVEPVYNYALAPVPYSLLIHPLDVTALPTNGGTRTITSTSPTFETLDDLGWAWFDVGADQVVHFDLSFSQSSALVFATGDLSIVSTISFPDQDPPVPGFQGWLRFPAPGRYYVILFDPGGAAGSSFTVTSRVTRVTPTPLDIGTPVTGAPFNDQGATWYTVDPSGETWLGATAGATGFGGNVRVDLFDPASVGQFDVDFDPFDSAAFNRNGSTTVGRIVFGTGAPALLRVTDAAGAAGAGDSYDLSIAERDFTDLGGIDESNPASLDGEPIPAGANAETRYFVLGTPGDTMTITATPIGFNARIDVLGPTENVIATVNAGGAGAPETIDVAVTDSEWIAFRVVRAAGAGTAFDLDVVATSPVPYDITTGSLSYADVCGPGQDITPSNTDDGLTTAATLPFDFDLFGGASGNSYQVSTNGWIAFGAVSDAAFSNPAMPDAGLPNGVLAPYWDDLANITICRLDAANRVTIQWNGNLFSDSSVAVQFQAVIRPNGRVDYIYGGGHEADGASGTVGIENLGGTFGHEMVRNSAGEVSPDSSFTLTPAP
jgi:hypothetical protein